MAERAGKGSLPPGETNAARQVIRVSTTTRAANNRERHEVHAE